MNLAEIELIVGTTEVEGATVVAHCVPTRAIRVLMLKDELTFRVEQLDPGVWKWSTLSTHSGDDPWESYEPALNAAVSAQARLKLKLQAAIQRQKMARLSILSDDVAMRPERIL